MPDTTTEQWDITFEAYRMRGMDVAWNILTFRTRIKSGYAVPLPHALMKALSELHELGISQEALDFKDAKKVETNA